MSSFEVIRSQIDQLQSTALNNLNVKVAAVYADQCCFEDSLNDMTNQIQQILKVQ